MKANWQLSKSYRFSAHQRLCLWHGKCDVLLPPPSEAMYLFTSSLFPHWLLLLVLLLKTREDVVGQTLIIALLNCQLASYIWPIYQRYGGLLMAPFAMASSCSSWLMNCTLTKKAHPFVMEIYAFMESAVSFSPFLLYSTKEISWKMADILTIYLISGFWMQRKLQASILCLL